VITVSSFADLEELAGTTLGPGRWRRVTQDDVEVFARVTDDQQWIHVDPERASEGPFGGTIAHGFYTLSLAVSCLNELLALDGFGMVVNYGLDRVRFPAPLPVGANLRMNATVESVGEASGGLQAALTLRFESDRVSKPVCVGQLLLRIYPGQDGSHA
jgi:acyl dehydratase